MKKVMCVLILVAFLGSMVVMTGCGGSSGIGALFAGALIIAIVATGPTAVAFAANTRPTHRTAIVAAAQDSAKYVARITPTGQTPTEVATVTVDVNKISFSGVTVSPSTNGQYLVEIFPAGYTAATAPIFKYYFTETVSSGATVDKTTTPYAINASDTARALIYDAWTGSTTTTIDHVTFNDTNVNDLSKQIETDLNALTVGGTTTVPASFDWSAAVDVLASTGANNVVAKYTASGYILAGDGVTGQSDAYVYIYQDQNMITDVLVTNGNYSYALPAGTYNFVPQKANHTYTPASQTVTISNTNVTGINFRAYPVQ